MPLIVPLQPVASQVVNVVLNGQQTTLRVYQAGVPLYMDVSVNDALIIGGVVCEQNNEIVRDAYLGFIGDFAFFDTQPDPSLGPLDPQPSGLGTRWILAYFFPSELPVGLTGP